MDPLQIGIVKDMQGMVLVGIPLSCLEWDEDEHASSSEGLVFMQSACISGR